MTFIEKAEKLGSDLVALAAQEGHDGEDWDKVQEAGFMLRELAFQLVTTEAPNRINRLEIEKDAIATGVKILTHRLSESTRKLYLLAFAADEYINFPCQVNAHCLRDAIAKARGQQ